LGRTQTETITIRVTPEEKYAIQELNAEARLSVLLRDWLWVLRSAWHNKSQSPTRRMARTKTKALIASLFWNINAFGDYCGEPLDANERPDSRTMQLRYRYINDVVSRYRSSPAIWGWEVGNELNLAVDLLRTRFVGVEGRERLFDTSLLTNYYRLVGEAIRSLDPHRLITGGDAAPRTASMALYRTKGEQEYGREGDVLLCLSTSGNSRNVVAAAKIAKAMGLTTVAMTGATESELSRLCDVTIRVPESETYKVQELHLPIYHDLCARLEKHFFAFDW